METQEVGLSYFRTIPGILKIAQEVVNFIGMICIAASHISPRAESFLASSIIALLLTAALIVFYVTGLVTKIDIPWYKIEFFYSIFISIFYLVTSSLVVSYPVKISAYIAGGIFGYIAILLYLADAFFKYQAILMS